MIALAMSNGRQGALRRELEDVFLAAEISEGADVGDDEGGGEAVFGADLAEVDAAIFEGEAAAAAVVADLHELALQDLVGEIVADTGGEIEAFTRQVSVAHQGANLVGKRLRKGDKTWRRYRRKIGFHRIVVEAEVGEGREEFTVRLHFQKGADGDEPIDLSIVLEDLFNVILTTRHDLDIADDGRPVAWTESESKGRYGVERLEDVALAVHDGAAESGIEIMRLENAPRN